MRNLILMIALISSSFLASYTSASEFISKLKINTLRNIECTERLELPSIVFDEFWDDYISFDILTHEPVLQAFLDWSKKDNLEAETLYMVGLDGFIFGTPNLKTSNLATDYKEYSRGIYIPWFYSDFPFQAHTKKTFWDFGRDIVFIHTVSKNSNYVEFCKYKKPPY